MLPLRDFIPTRRPAVMTASLILANLAVFLWELGTTEIRVDHYAYYPCSVEGPCTGIAVDHLPAYEGALSAMFLHASWVHVLGNMLFLWIFGNNIEDALGRFRFLLWYIAAGLVATGAQTFVTLRYAGPEAASVPNIGASGAIAAVLGAYLVLLPNARVLTSSHFGDPRSCASSAASCSSASARGSHPSPARNSAMLCGRSSAPYDSARSIAWTTGAGSGTRAAVARRAYGSGRRFASARVRSSACSGGRPQKAR